MVSRNPLFFKRLDHDTPHLFSHHLSGGVLVPGTQGN